MRQIPLRAFRFRGDKELRRAMALASLQESWRYAQEQNFDQVSEDEIEDEIQKARQRKPDAAQ